MLQLEVVKSMSWKITNPQNNHTCDATLY